MGPYAQQPQQYTGYSQPYEQQGRYSQGGYGVQAYGAGTAGYSGEAAPQYGAAGAGAGAGAGGGDPYYDADAARLLGPGGSTIFK